MCIRTKDIYILIDSIGTEHRGTVDQTCNMYRTQQVYVQPIMIDLLLENKQGYVAPIGAGCSTEGVANSTQTRVSAGPHHVVLHEVTDCFPSAGRDEVGRVPQKDGTVCHRATPLVEQGFLDGSLGDCVSSTHKLWKKYRYIHSSKTDDSYPVFMYLPFCLAPRLPYRSGWPENLLS